MFGSINEIGIVVSALLALAVGSIWYSPLLFGKVWEHAIRIADTDLSFSRGELARSVTFGFIANVVLMSIIDVALHVVPREVLTPTVLAVMVIGLLLATLGSMVVWEKRGLAYFAIHSGYGVVIVLIGIGVLTLWPW